MRAREAMGAYDNPVQKRQQYLTTFTCYAKNLKRDGAASKSISGNRIRNKTIKTIKTEIIFNQISCNLI
ncbi:MAG: hypothetical protein QXU95_03235 [Candidatus Bathyarchaeia archaeon]